MKLWKCPDRYICEVLIFISPHRMGGIATNPSGQPTRAPVPSTWAGGQEDSGQNSAGIASFSSQQPTGSIDGAPAPGGTSAFARREHKGDGGSSSARSSIELAGGKSRSKESSRARGPGGRSFLEMQLMAARQASRTVLLLGPGAILSFICCPFNRGSQVRSEHAMSSTGSAAEAGRNNRYCHRA